MKRPKLLAIVCVAGVLASCSDSSEATEIAEESKCPKENNVHLTVEKYGYQFDSEFTYNENFEIKRSDWTQSSDSAATLSLYNYNQGESGEDNVEIRVEFHSKNGNKIGPGVYNHTDYQSDYWSKTTIETSNGRVYFNWNMGMPKQGYVEIIDMNDDEVCGSFNLKVENYKLERIGHVELSGDWSSK